MKWPGAETTTRPDPRRKLLGLFARLGVRARPGWLVVGEQCIVIVHPLSRQARFRQHAKGLADHRWRASDVGLTLPVRHVAGGYPAHVALHPVKGRVIRGHWGELETLVG